MRCRHGTVDVHEIIEREAVWHFSNGELDDGTFTDGYPSGSFLVRCLLCGTQRRVSREKVETAADWLRLPLLAIQQKVK